MKPKIARFVRASTFACPLCKEALKFQDHSLVCTNRHSFDIAKYGYVNLAPQIRQSKDYDKDNFIQRQIILEAGFYQHILQEIEFFLQQSPDTQTILDVGCGQGYYLSLIHI